jgi:hypothetical protein
MSDTKNIYPFSLFEIGNDKPFLKTGKEYPKTQNWWSQRQPCQVILTIYTNFKAHTAGSNVELAPNRQAIEAILSQLPCLNI